VQVKAGHAHVLDGLGFVKLGKDGTYLIAQVGSNPAGIVLFKERFKPHLAFPVSPKVCGEATEPSVAIGAVLNGQKLLKTVPLNKKPRKPIPGRP
jgi:hypothetical protein